MKIEMYKSEKGTDGYKLIAETKEEKLILGSFRNGAFLTDGKFVYEGYTKEGDDRKANLVTWVKIAHNRTIEDVLRE